MRRRTGRLGSMLAVALALGVALPAAAGDATPGATPTVGPGYTLTSQGAYGSRDTIPLALSPDGTAVAIWDRSGDGAVCSSPTITRQAPTCAPFAGSVAPDSVRWSPDGTRFAFTENVVTSLYESDIHVFDASTGEVVNLTDDGVDGGLLGIEGDADLDLAPAWSPDGQSIAFFRNPWVDGAAGEGAYLYRVPADGAGEAEEIARVSTVFLAGYGGIHWTDPDRILFSVASSSADEDNGIWTIDTDGGRPDRVVDAFTDAGTGLILVDVTADGIGLLLDQLAGRESGSIPGPRYYTVDLATGTADPLDFGASELSPTDLLRSDSDVPISVTAAGFSPDGASLATVVFLPDQSFQLRIIDIGTGDDAIAGPLDSPLGQNDLRPGIDWGENNLLFSPGPGKTGVLMTVEQNS